MSYFYYENNPAPVNEKPLVPFFTIPLLIPMMSVSEDNSSSERSTMLIRNLLVVVVVLGAASFMGCGDPDPGACGDSDDPCAETGSISGVVAVLAQATRSTMTEQEPNDTFEDVGVPIVVEAGTRLEIFGELSSSSSDLTDSFLFQVTSAAGLKVRAILSFDFNPQDPAENNLALGISDGSSANCTIGPESQSFVQCVDTDKNPEVSIFEVSGDFGLAIRAVAGEPGYVLGLEFFAAGSSARHEKILRQIADESTAENLSEEQLPGRAFIPSEVLLTFETQVTEDQSRDLIARNGLILLQKSPSGVYRCRRSAGKSSRYARLGDTLRTVEALQAVTGVRLVEPNYRYYPARLPNDEHIELQWNYPLINLPEAWDLTVGSADVIIAVVDTGILGDHPDISDRLIQGYDFISDPNSSRDGDGLDGDPTDDGDLSGGPGNSSYHGTHVTGILGASTDNGLDIAGVTWACPIMPVRALGVGGGSSFDIGEAIRYAAGIDNVSGLTPDRPANIINLSIATPAGSLPSLLMGNAIREAVAKGVVVVAAAGNESSSLPAYPAGFAETIGVAACDAQLELAPYSNFGSTIDLTAPGGNLSADLTGDGFGDGVLSLIGIETNGALDLTLSFQHGTSMATPHISGVLALMLSVNAELTPSELLEILKQTAIDVGPTGPDTFFGAGVVNAAAAVLEASVRAGQQTPSEPRLSLSTSTLDFGTSQDQLTVQITNTGGGILDVTAVTAEEFIAAGWLAIEQQATSGNTNVSGITARVDRNGLNEGTYVGRITVSAAGLDNEVIDVQMRVGEAAVTTELIFVVAVDAVTRETIAQDVTSAERGFAFEISNLAPNAYKIYAGTDRDQDDQICDLGELCGGFPSAIVANEVTVQAGETISEISFPLGDIIFEPQTARRAKLQTIHLLD